MTRIILTAMIISLSPATWAQDDEAATGSPAADRLEQNVDKMDAKGNKRAAEVLRRNADRKRGKDARKAEKRAAKIKAKMERKQRKLARKAEKREAKMRRKHNRKKRNKNK